MVKLNNQGFTLTHKSLSTSVIQISCMDLSMWMNMKQAIDITTFNEMDKKTMRMKVISELTST